MDIIQIYLFVFFIGSFFIFEFLRYIINFSSIFRNEFLFFLDLFIIPIFRSILFRPSFIESNLGIILRILYGGMI